MHVRHQYDIQARFYDLLWRGYTRRTLNALEGKAQIHPDERVLDVACGTGAFGARLLARHPDQHYAGADVSEGMLAAAREKLGAAPNVSLQQASAEGLPFEDGAFDVVVSASAVHYFPDPVQAFREMRRVLAPGGRIVILDWCRDFPLMQLMDAFLRRFDPAHRHTYTQAELRTMLESADLRVQHLRAFRSGLVWGLMAGTATR